MREILTVGIGAWRLARLLVSEEGPLEMFERLRAVAGVPTVGYSHHREIPVLTGILKCPWCCSVWAAALLWPLRRTAIAQILAAAGVAAILVAFEEKER